MTKDIVKDIDPMDSFKEKIIASLRDNIREMMPEAALSELVNRAVDETFFQPRVDRDRWGHEKTRQPSWFVEEVAKAAEPMLRESVNALIKARRDEIDAAINEFVNDKNLTLIAVRSMTSDLSVAIQTAVLNLSRGY